MADTSVTIDIQANATSAQSAATIVDSLSSSLTTAQAASASAASAVAEAESRYAQLESGADRAAKAVERISVAAAAQQGKLQAALDVGDMAGADAAAAKLADLTAKQAELTAAATAANAALAEEGAALDGLRSAASSAADAEAKLANDLKSAQKSLDAIDAKAPTGKVNELAEGFGALGGPVGALGQKVFGTVDKLQKLGNAGGSAMTLIAGGAALAVAAVVALGAGLFSITSKLVEWADTTGRLGKM